MLPSDLSAIFTAQDKTAPTETFRRIGIFLNALAAIPKKSWRPRVNARGIRVEGPGLSRMHRLLDCLEISFRDRSIVHVAGTSGKGSTALMIAEALHAAGRRTAAFFSPHVTSLAERFWAGGGLAGADVAGRAAARVAEAAAEMAHDADAGPPSYFEGALALLLLVADEGDCEFIVLEAGLGGTYDATNAVTPGILDVITPGGRVISAPLPPGAAGEIAGAASERGAALHFSPGIEYLKCGDDGCVFDLRFGGGELGAGVRGRMAGAHQAGNAAMAAGACRLLGLEEEDIRAGLMEARLPCRIERMPGEPRVILDGAHNGDKVRALIAALPPGPRFFVLGAVGDKDYMSLAEELAGPEDRFFVTVPPGDAPRPGLPPRTFARALREFGATHVTEFVDPWQAFDAALIEADGEGLIVVAGSLFLAGEIRKRWVSEEQIIEAGHAFPPEMRT